MVRSLTSGDQTELRPIGVRQHPIVSLLIRIAAIRSYRHRTGSAAQTPSSSCTVDATAPPVRPLATVAWATALAQLPPFKSVEPHAPAAKRTQPQLHQRTMGSSRSGRTAAAALAVAALLLCAWAQLAAADSADSSLPAGSQSASHSPLSFFAGGPHNSSAPMDPLDIGMAQAMKMDFWSVYVFFNFLGCALCAALIVRSVRGDSQ